MTTLAPKKEYVLPDVSRLKFTEKGHYYELDGKKLTGVTTVIDGTSSKQNLIGWAANMAVDFIKGSSENRPCNQCIEDDAYSVAMSDLGMSDGGIVCTHKTPDRIVVTYEILEEARTAYARKRDKAASKGTDVHALVEEYINFCLENDGKPFSVDSTSLTLTAYGEVRPFAEWAQSNVDRFLAAEQRLYSEDKALAGTCDFVAIINGKLTIGDLKTFPKMWSADAFIQMGAYSLMWNELTGERPEQSVVVKMCDPSDERIKKYGGKPFAVYPRYALAEDEQIFLKRLDIYRYNQNFTSPKE